MLSQLILNALNLIEKKQMKDKCFLDTNILLYILSDDDRKFIAKDLIKLRHTISIQVLNEFSNVCVRKFKFTTNDTKIFIEAISDKVNIESYSKTTILGALDLKNKYNLQFYDALIISTAIENNCNILYSEDMQDGLIINDMLTIINPFKKIQ